MVEVGKYNILKVLRNTTAGIFLDDGETGILLPKRYVPNDIKVGDTLKVFIYHDNESRLIATTETPKAIVGDIACLEVTDITGHGAFLNNGIMKDIFIHKSNMLQPMQVSMDYLVYIYIDKVTSRITASQRIEDVLINKDIEIREKEKVDLIAYRKTDIGYIMIINKKYMGLLHSNEVYKPIMIGATYEGFVKKIIPNITDENAPYKIDISLGKMGYDRVEDETEKIIRLLKENQNYLPFHDKSPPDEIYAYFAMSKKTFKMAVGQLYKSKKIILESKGIRLV